MLARRNAAAVLGPWMMLGQPAPSSGLIFPKPIGAFRRCRLGTGPALRMGSQMPMRCVAPSASPLSLTPPFADEACVASDSSADSLLQRFVQDTMLNQQQTQIPTELLDVDESQSLHHRAFDLWGWLSQGEYRSWLMRCCNLLDRECRNQ